MSASWCFCTSPQGLAPKNEGVLWKDITALTLMEYQEEEIGKMDLETRSLTLIFMISYHHMN